MKIGVIGSGEVAQTLGVGFLRHGHEVMLGTSHPAKLKDWLKENDAAHMGSFEDAAAFGELVVLAVKGAAAEDVVRGLEPRLLAGKTVMDATNPIAEAAPQDGVLTFTASVNASLMETLQEMQPKARFVKAFNSVGAASMVNPDFGGVKPTMFLCGNDEGAKKQVVRLIEELGWEAADMGTARAAGSIETLSVLWCIPGFTRNEWTHAFKVLRR